MIEALMKCKIFKDVDPAYVEQLERTNEILTLEKGEKLFEQGDPGAGMYVVLSGKLEVILHNGYDHVVATIEEGSFLGEISMLIDQVRTATLKSAEKSRLIYLDAPSFKKQIEENNTNALKIVYNISQMLALRLAKANDIIRNLQLQIEPTQKEIAKFRDILLSEVLL